MAVADISWVSVSAPASLTADAGSFTLTGQAATFGYTAPTATISWISVDQGTYRLTADAGTFTLSGQAATLTYGAFNTQALISLIQVQAGSLGNYTLTADPGTFVVNVAPSQSDFVLGADVGAFTLTGRDASLTTGITVDQATGAVVYIPLRVATGIWSQAEVVDENNLTNLRSWLPHVREPLATIESPGSTPKSIYMAPTWYRFFEFVANVKLGGAQAPTVTDIQNAVVDSLNSSAAIEANQQSLITMSEQNAAALAATVEVVRAENLTGSQYIPPVARGVSDI